MSCRPSSRPDGPSRCRRDIGSRHGSSQSRHEVSGRNEPRARGNTKACVRRSEDGRGSLGFGGEPDGDEGGDVVDAVLLVLIVVAGGNTRVEKEEGSEKRGYTEVGNNVAEIVVGQLHF